MTAAAIGYTRLSQTSDLSIDRQKRHIREYADEHGFDVDRIFDDGELSSAFKPEDLDQYQLLKNRIVDDPDVAAVIVNDKRRLVRDIDEVLRLVADLRTHSVEVHTYDDGPLDLSDPIKAAIEILQAAAAYQEKMKEIQRAIEAVEERMNDPDTDHGRPRFGMQYDEAGDRQIPGDEFETVRDILLLRDRGMSYREIEERLSVPRSTANRVVRNREWYEERVAMQPEGTSHA